jgi:hypothetical protein
MDGDVCGSSLCALVMACYIACCMQVWSYSGFAMLVPCQAKIALLPLENEAI